MRPVEGEKNLPVILVDVFKTFIEVVNNLSGLVVNRCLHFCQRWSEGQWNSKQHSVDQTMARIHFGDQFCGVQ